MESNQYAMYGRKHYEKNKEKITSAQKKYYHERGGKAVKQNKYREERRDAVLRSRYGITASDYDVLKEQQNNQCAICSTDYSVSNRNMDVDHCHETGKVRGLLCNNCNRGLGHFQDSPDLLRAAAKYLEDITGKGGSCGV